jgi:putative ABC transport system permease protein
MKDHFSLAFNNLRRRKLRSWLTMIGIFIGIAAVVALISLGQGLQGYLTETFEQMGANKLIVMPGSGMGIGMIASADKLTNRDLEVIEKTKGVDMAAEIIYGSTLIKFKDEAKANFVIGLPTDESADVFKEIGGFETTEGRDLKEEDKYKIVIGYLVAKDNGFFDKAVQLRDKLVIKNKEFRVVGVMGQIGNPQDDSQVYIPLETAKEIFDKQDEIDAVYVQIKMGYEPADVAEDIKKQLRKARNEKQGEETFSVQTFEQLLETFQSVFAVVQAVLVGIAGISLLVGGIGIMNTMYTAVMERTKEIGTMKAVGAKNSDILFIFLFESGLLGLVGGAIGIGIGIGLGKGAEYLATMALGTDLLQADTSMTLIGGALMFSFLIGATSGVLPAMQAAKLKPADALRRE